MRPFTRQDLTILLSHHEQPCVTLAMRTWRRLPEAHQHPVQYANLVREAATALEKKYGKKDAAAAAVLERLEELGGNGFHPEGLNAFWHRQKDGLAVFASPDHFAHYGVPLALRPTTVVADNFHVKPLLPLLYHGQRYHVLVLTAKDVKLHEGGEDEIHELPLNGVPKSLHEALGTETVDARAGMAAHGGPGGSHALHGYGEGSDEHKDELRRFFRAVDRAVDEKHSRPTGLPLIVAAVDYYHPLYHEVAHDKHLVKQGIMLDPKALTSEQLRAAAWKVIEPLLEAKVAEAIEEFGSARAWNQGSSEIEHVAIAAAAGRVKRLLIEERRRISGRLNRATGEVAVAAAVGGAHDVDLLDEVAELVLLHGGEVFLVPREKMPSATGAAATYRF